MYGILRRKRKRAIIWPFLFLSQLSDLTRCGVAAALVFILYQVCVYPVLLNVDNVLCELIKTKNRIIGSIIIIIITTTIIFISYS